MRIFPSALLLVGFLGRSHGETLALPTNASLVSGSLYLRGQTDGGSTTARKLQETVVEEVAAEPAVVNNIGYVFKGYDLVMGNPLETTGLVKVDQGFRQSIFKQTNYVETPDKQFMTPQGVNVVECEGCNLAFSSTEVRSTSEYKSTLEAKAKVSGSSSFGAIKGEFSASAGYKEAKERFGSNHETSTTSEVSCCVYQAELESFKLPPYSSNFVTAVNKLVAVFNNNLNLVPWIRKFVDEFGTHFVKKVTMGSIYGEQTFISSSDMKSMLSQGINIELAASASGAFGAGKAEGSLDYDAQKTMTFRNSASKRNVYSRGAKPPGDGDVTKWLEQSSNNPVPTYTELQSISDLPIFDGKAGVRTALRNYLNGYCEAINPGQCTAGEEGVNAIINLIVTDQQAGMHDQRTTTQQNQLKHYGVRNFGAMGIGVTGHGTSNAWVYVGLQGKIQGAKGWDRGYKANVADFGAGYDHRDPYNVHGWSSNDKAFTFRCDPNTAVVQIKATGHDSSNSQDRRFIISCGGFPGMDIMEAGWRDNNLGMSSKFSDFPWRNDFTTDLDYTCPRNHVMIGVESVHDNGTEQRKWKILCGKVIDKWVANRISITPYINDLERSFSYWTRANTVLVGLRGARNTASKDTMFQFIEKGLPNGVTTNSYEWSNWLNTKDANGKEQEHFDFSCPGGQGIVGMSSNFKRSPNNPNVDREFKFECRSILNHNLLHADGRTARPTSLPADGDWSYIYQGLGVNFALECPAGKILTGVSVRYDDIAQDRGWKIMCLELSRI
ncbi:MAC Perforin domain containing protein [Seminavis robusta]|uniref:MAC Perforin domain containing protein n=1 Tax=Seminavis robusta TaxID=568900 RepID=A0A9N8EF05_9STRA|nr:MAC Perforin domain containing protein [Seminavis robusta]|eukprot:Sro904_g218350.1 MAC Perforin domain containing protein (779) ;mRNA; r:6798-9945